MQKYSSNAIDLFYNSKFSGATVGADAITKNENKETGEVVKVYLVVRDNKIKSISFQALGSINLFACMTTLCGLAQDKTLEDAEKITEKDIITALKQISKQDYSKVTYSILSLKKAIILYRKKRDKGTLNQRDSRKKEVFPSKNITVFKSAKKEKELLHAEDIITTKNIKQMQEENSNLEEKASKSVKNAKTTKSKTKPESKEKKQSKEKPKKEQKQESSASSEMAVSPVKTKKGAKPTRIEVRVVDTPNNEESSVAKVITTTTKTEKKVNGEVVENTEDTKTKIVNEDGVESENMIDEIDNITEQLTNALSQLNFKFDETPKEEQKKSKKKK